MADLSSDGRNILIEKESSPSKFGLLLLIVQSIVVKYSKIKLYILSIKSLVPLFESEIVRFSIFPFSIISTS